MILKIRWLFP